MMGQQKEANNKLEELTDPLSLKEKKIELLVFVNIIYLYIYVLYVYIQDRALVSSELYIPKLLILVWL